MLLAGDEIGRTQRRQQQRLLPGQRDQLARLEPGRAAARGLLDFVAPPDRGCGATHPVFRRRDFFQRRGAARTAQSQGRRVAQARRRGDDRARSGTSDFARALGVYLAGDATGGDRRARPAACATTSFLRAVQRASRRRSSFMLPDYGAGRHGSCVVDTDASDGRAGRAFQPRGAYAVAARSLVLLQQARAERLAGGLQRRTSRKRASEHEATRTDAMPFGADDRTVTPARFRLWAPGARDVAVMLGTGGDERPSHMRRCPTAGTRRASPTSAPARATPSASTAGSPCPIRPRASIPTTCTRRARWSIRAPTTGATIAGAAGRGTRR